MCSSKRGVMSQQPDDSETMRPEQTLFSLKDVTCMRGGRVLFRNLSLALQAGETLQLKGMNGAGKTSLLRILSNRLAADGYFSENNDVVFMPADDRALKAQETAIENLTFWKDLWGRGDVAASLAAAGLADLKDVPARRLSAGQRRRLSLARVYLSGAALWLLDEPVNGLDDAARDSFILQLRRHAAAGGGAVIAAHQDLPVTTVKILEAA